MTAILDHSPSKLPAMARQRVTDVLRAEWLKLRTVRSTWVTLLVTFVLTVGLSALICKLYVHQTSQLSLTDRARFDPAALSESGVSLAQIAIGVLGVLVMTGETSTGMIRLSLAAVPRRALLYLSKAGVFLAVSLGVGLVTTFSSFFAGQAVLTGHTVPTLLGTLVPANTTLGANSSLRVVLGAAAYLAAIGLIGMSFGAVIRRTAGAVAALFGLLLVVPIIVAFLPSRWNNDISKYLPGQAGSAIMQVRTRVDLLSPTWGAILLALYVLVSLGVGLIFFVRRDA